MTKKVAPTLVFIAGIIILISESLIIAICYILYRFVNFTQLPSPALAPYIEGFAKYLTHPLQLIILLITLGLGVFFIVASKKIKIPEKSYKWSIISLVVGLIIIFELHGGGLFGGITAGILTTIGGGIGLHESQKNLK